jgi:hypothetical protein
MKIFLARLVLLFLLCILPISCDEEDDNYLDGSLTDSFDMSFSGTRVRLYESELSIEYVKGSGPSEKVPLILTLKLSEGPLAEGISYDLKAIGNASRGQGGYGSPLPELDSGTLTFSSYSEEDGATIEGSFQSIFNTLNNTQQTLRGGFSASLEVVK